MGRCLYSCVLEFDFLIECLAGRRGREREKRREEEAKWWVRVGA